MGIIADVVGWVGAGLVLIAYFLITRGAVSPRSKTYHVINLLGGAFLGYNTFVYSAYPSTLVNGFWVCIAVYGLWRGLS